MRTRPAHVLLSALCALVCPMVSAAGQSAPAPEGSTSEATRPSVRGWPAMLIDDQLEPRLISLVGIEGDAVIFMDDAGRRRTAIVDTLMALLPAPTRAEPARVPLPSGARDESISPRITREQAPAAPRGIIELIDGQRFPGEIVPTSGEEESIIWNHPAFGNIAMPLERVARLFRDTLDPVLTRSVRDAAPHTQDELLLANGDRVRGFIIGLADPAQIETDGRVVEIPAERIAGALLANDASVMSGLIVWLADGTVASLDSVVTLSGNELALTLPGGQSATYEIDDLRAISFDSERLAPLSSLVPARQEAIGSRLYVTPIQHRPNADEDGSSGVSALDAQDVVLPGPMLVEYRLPRGAVRFAGVAALDGGSAPWGDCEFVVAVDGREQFRTRLVAGREPAPFNLRIRGEALTITVEPGNYGPIRDRVVIRRPLLAVDRSAI